MAAEHISGLFASTPRRQANAATLPRQFGFQKFTRVFMFSFFFKWVTTACLVITLQACAVVAVADAAVTVVATGVTIAAKTVGAVADVVLPDGDDD
jgi:hypothetical protein